MQSAPGLSFLLQAGMEVAFVPPVLDAPRRAHVEDVAAHGDGKTAEVRFSGIEGREAAEMLVGSFILARRSELPQGFDETEDSPWLGFAVVDRSAGAIGQVVEVIDNPGQSLLRVQASAGEVLVPFVDAIVIDIDEAGSTLYVELPAGLLELAQEEAFDAGRGEDVR